MLRYIYGEDLPRHPVLERTMFFDRAEQFSKRLGWQVSVNEDGFERDQYDELNPLYAIWQLPDGTHGGSMRFLPTHGRTMVNEHFSHLNRNQLIRDSRIWECTRLVVSARAGRKTAASLILAAGEVLNLFNLRSFCGVFDARMERIYRLYNVSPKVLATAGIGKSRISLGLWGVKPDAWDSILKSLGITRETSVKWLHASLPAQAQVKL